jgi:alpha-L-rhamnosidase
MNSGAKVYGRVSRSAMCRIGTSFLSRERLCQFTRELTGIIFILMAVCSNGVAQDFPATNHPWHAQWITAPGLPPSLPAVLYFQRTIDLPVAPQQFTVHVSADNAFLLHVNGKFVGRGPAHGDLTHWRFESFDLAPFLHQGSNIIASVIWNFGEYKAVAQITSGTAFVLQGASPGAEIADTNEHWQVELDRGIAFKPVTSSILHGYYAAEPIEVIHAESSDLDWDTSIREPARWTAAVSLGEAAWRGARDSHSSWQLVPDLLPPMESTPTPGGKVVRYAGLSSTSSFPDGPVVIPAHSLVSILLDNSEITTAYPGLTLSGGKGATIRLTYAEALQDKGGGKGNRNDIAGKTIAGVYDEYIADGAPSRRFAPLTWRTWRYLQIDVSTDEVALQLDSFQSTFSAFPFVERARFDSDDPELSTIWNIGWHTARIDAHDTYMDTAYWERLQYVGDTRLQALISYAMAGDDRLARQAIAAINESRLPDGITLSRYPTSTFQAIPPFSLLWIGMLHDFAIYRDDPAFVRDQLPGSRAILGWFLEHQNANGLVGLLPWWPFVDWVSDFHDGIPPQEANGDSTIITLHLIEALREAAELEGVYGDPYLAQRYQQAAARSVHAIRTLCWSSRYHLFADTPAGNHFSQHANAMAVWLDVAPRLDQHRIVTRILFVNHTDNSPAISPASYYYSFYVARALQHANMGDEYIHQLQPWRNMIALGLTTWAEQPEPTRSDSHAWSSHPNFDLLNIVAGIQSASLGFRTVRIAPSLGTLHRLTASYPHPKGAIRVQYTRENGRFRAAIQLPPGLQGTFYWRHRAYPILRGSLDLSVPDIQKSHVPESRYGMGPRRTSFLASPMNEGSVAPLKSSRALK